MSQPRRDNSTMRSRMSGVEIVVGRKQRHIRGCVRGESIHDRGWRAACSQRAEGGPRVPAFVVPE